MSRPAGHRAAASGAVRRRDPIGAAGRRLLPAGAAAALAALVLPADAFAHGLGGITDLPVPGWLFLVGGATVLVVSFVALGVLWHEPLLEGRGRELPGWISAIVLSRITAVVLGAFSIGLFALVWSAAVFGSSRTSLNLAPSFVYVLFWVGIAVVAAVVGDVWRVLDPWHGIAVAVSRASGAVGLRWSPRAYPARLGLWPATALLFAFIALELVKKDPSTPHTLATAITVYSAFTWAGMLVFGREAWRENGDGFAVYFRFLSRIALFGTEERAGRRVLVLRRPLSALTIPERRPGSVALVAVMLGSVAFDGFSRSTLWQNDIYDLRGRFTSEAAADRAEMALNMGVLLLAMAIVAAAYTLAVTVAARVAGGGVDFRGIFLGSLIPIAFVYVVAHYLTFLLIQGQFVIPLLSDPYGRGWDVLGTADFEPNLGLLSPNQTWYIQVTALVLGHVAGLVVAHDRAVALVSSARQAARTQLAMLVLMIFYTVGGMWLLSLT